MNRTELIAALEAAPGPSRELDREIEIMRMGFHTDRLIQWEIPYYTESIDAALSFTPEGEWITLEIRPKKAHCEFTDRDNVDARNCATPAIAVCIANFRALGEDNE